MVKEFRCVGSFDEWSNDAAFYFCHVLHCECLIFGAAVMIKLEKKKIRTLEALCFSN